MIRAKAQREDAEDAEDAEKPTATEGGCMLVSFLTWMGHEPSD